MMTATPSAPAKDVQKLCGAKQHPAKPSYLTCTKSGVTLGPGYDMHQHAAKEIAATLTAIGVNEAIALKVGIETEKLTGPEAQAYALKNGKNGTQLIHLRPEQQVMLQSLYLPTYEAILRRIFTVSLVKREYEALVSLATNAGGSLHPIANALLRGEVSSALAEILRRTLPTSPLHKGMVNRRRREVQWFIAGRYTV